LLTVEDPLKKISVPANKSHLGPLFEIPNRP
jgi:hypothetical protein